NYLYRFFKLRRSLLTHLKRTGLVAAFLVNMISGGVFANTATLSEFDQFTAEHTRCGTQVEKIFKMFPDIEKVKTLSALVHPNGRCEAEPAALVEATKDLTVINQAYAYENNKERIEGCFKD